MAANPCGCPSQKLFRRKNLLFPITLPTLGCSKPTTLLQGSASPSLLYDGPTSMELLLQLLPHSNLAVSPSGKALGACRASWMASPLPETSRNRGALREEGSQVQLPTLPPVPTSPSPQRLRHNLPVAKELHLPTAPDRFPALFPTDLPARDMAADTGSSVQTRAPYELFLALWLKILGRAVLSGRGRSRKRRAKESISDPRMGEEPHGSLKQWGQLLAPPQAYADGHCRSSTEEEGV